MNEVETGTGCCDVVLRNCPAPSPFGKIIIVDWYDGPVSGAALCRAEQHAFSFRMAAWDGSQRKRVYLLSPLRVVVFGDLQELFSSSGEPRWPVWWPKPIEDQERSDREWNEAQRLLASGGRVEYVLVAEGLERVLNACRLLAPDDVGAVTEMQGREAEFDEWLAFVTASPSV